MPVSVVLPLSVLESRTTAFTITQKHFVAVQARLAVGPVWLSSLVNTVSRPSTPAASCGSATY